ncbi:MAG: hypothetical protein SF069_04655 [Phycisphaerae bacterium]|nr:hypothetical protein [Phycisphaerae bacterium]
MQYLRFAIAVLVIVILGGAFFVGIRHPLIEPRPAFSYWQGKPITGRWRPCWIVDRDGWNLFVDRERNSALVAPPSRIPQVGRVWWELKDGRLVVHAEGADTQLALEDQSNQLIVVRPDGQIRSRRFHCRSELLWPEGSVCAVSIDETIEKLIQRMCNEDISRLFGD